MIRFWAIVACLLASMFGVLGLFLQQAHAQTPNPVTPGYQVCSTADPGNTHCSFQPVDATHGLPVTSVASTPGTIIGTVGVDQTTPGTTNGVVVNSSALPAGAATAANQTNGSEVVSISATASATNAIVPSPNASATGTNIFKASAGNLYGVEVTTGGTAGFLMVLDSTTVPADGAVVPKYCKVVAANSSAELSWTAGPPAAFATGITAVFSSTGCFNKTLSATAYITGMVK